MFISASVGTKFDHRIDSPMSGEDAFLAPGHRTDDMPALKDFSTVSSDDFNKVGFCELAQRIHMVRSGVPKIEEVAVTWDA